MYLMQIKQLIPGAPNHGEWVSVPGSFADAERAKSYARYRAQDTFKLDIRVIRRLAGKDTVICNVRAEDKA